jgi:hypothetical protein
MSASGAVATPLMHTLKTAAAQHDNGLHNGQVANRDGAEPTACGVRQPRDHEAGDCRDEGVSWYGEHSPA